MIQGDQDTLGHFHLTCSYTSKDISIWCGSRVIEKLSQTPSATLSSTTMRSSASSTPVHHKLIWCMFIYYFFKDKSIQNGPKVISVLSDTLSDLNKLNYVEYSTYQLCSQKIGMAYVDPGTLPILVEHNYLFLYLPWLTLMRPPRVPQSIFLGPF